MVLESVINSTEVQINEEITIGGSGTQRGLFFFLKVRERHGTLDVAENDALRRDKLMMQEGKVRIDGAMWCTGEGTGANAQV